MKTTAAIESIVLGGRRLNFQRVRSRTARRLRVRVGLDGVEVLQPQARPVGDVCDFLRAHQGWLFGELDRVESLRALRRPPRGKIAELSLRGKPVGVRVERDPQWRGANRVELLGNEIVIRCGHHPLPPHRSLENWLRREARADITHALAQLTARLKRVPRRLYVMEQRTKWGNCSAQQNLSFNWRLILAPPFVLRYLVTHEAVHLAVPDHSDRFWLLVQSLCPETERARQWLVRHADDLKVALTDVSRCEA